LNVSSRRRSSTPQIRPHVRWTGLPAPPRLGLNWLPQISHGLADLDPVLMPPLSAQGFEQNRCDGLAETYVISQPGDWHWRGADAGVREP
jgi:hypothetical protein